MSSMDKLHFLTAGMPRAAEGKGYKKAFEILGELDLDGMELEFVHGVRMNDENVDFIRSLTDTKRFLVTAHGPYYINLNSEEDEKIEASERRIIETAEMAARVGAYSITFHAAFNMKKDAATVYKQVYKCFDEILGVLKKEKIKVWVRPETTGKATQWGDLDEVIKIARDFPEHVLPCIDFSHLHARSAGGFNTYDEFAGVLDKLGNELGDRAIKNFHGHLAGIAYGDKGEKNHLNLDESDMKYKDLLKVLKEFGVTGALVCESPNIEVDCGMIKRCYLSL